MSRDDGVAEGGMEGVAASTARAAWQKEGRGALGELLATALLVLLGCMTLIPTEDGKHQPLAHPALAFGFLVVANVMVFGRVSGAHMNPAVTLTALLLGECAPYRAVLYAAAQYLGATLGFGLLVSMSPMDIYVMRAACTVPNRISVLQALMVEIVLTFVLGLVCCAAWRPAGSSSPPPHDPALPIKFGLTVAGLIYAGGLLSGASLNPARSFAPALWTGHWTAHWVYWCGPLGGAALAALLYRWVLAPPAPTPPPLPEAPLELLLHKRDA